MKSKIESRNSSLIHFRFKIILTLILIMASISFVEA